MEIWKHRGLNQAFAAAEPQIRRAAREANEAVQLYRVHLEAGFNGVAQQLNENPHDAVFADVHRMRGQRDNPWYVAYSEFDDWLMIYEVIGDTSYVRKVAQMRDGAGLASIIADLS